MMESARRMGRAVAASGRTLVYGGGRVGLMGALADAALAAGGPVIGVIPEFLSGKEIAHASVTELRVVQSMHERKALMAELSDAFIALPGGFGTLEEFFEMLTWWQLGLHTKPYGLLNVAGFFDPLLAFLDRLFEQGFVPREQHSILLVDDDEERLLDRLSCHRPPPHTRWLDLKKT